MVLLHYYACRFTHCTCNKYGSSSVWRDSWMPAQCRHHCNSWWIECMCVFDGQVQHSQFQLWSMHWFNIKLVRSSWLTHLFHISKETVATMRPVNRIIIIGTAMTAPRTGGERDPTVAVGLGSTSDFEPNGILPAQKIQGKILSVDISQCGTYVRTYISRNIKLLTSCVYRSATDYWWWYWKCADSWKCSGSVKCNIWRAY